MAGMPNDEELREISTALMSAEKNIDIVVTMLGHEEALKTHLRQALAALSHVQIRWKQCYDRGEK